LLRFRAAVASLVASASVVVLCACEATTPQPRAPKEPTPGCWLENAMAKFGDPDPSVQANCGLTMPEGICDDECKKAVHDCVLQSARAFRPFSITWTNNLIDSIGTRRGVAGRTFPGGFEVTWLEYTYVSAIDPGTGEMAKGKVKVVARRCRDMDDLMEVCDPRLTAGSESCAQSARTMRDNAWLRCIGDEEPFCAD
jgi:hypothetical protein